jgi:dTDP-4-dehydrorhamnose reductase
LITGITGVPGYNAFFYFRSRYGDQVIGQRPRANERLQGPGIVACDLEESAEIASLFERYRFRSVLNCGGSCALKSCELDREMARRVNVLGVGSLLRQIAGSGTRLVHLSIDLVFSGSKGGDYREIDPPDPVTVYGDTMFEAESLVLADAPAACILRISLPMGISFNGHAGAIDWIQSRFKKGKPATLYYDEVRTPTYVECMNDLYERLLAGRLSGIFHAGGPRKMTLFQIAQIVNRVGGYDPRLLQGCFRIQAGPVPPRAGDVTLDSAKLTEALGFAPLRPWPWCADQLPDHRNWHFERGGIGPHGPDAIARMLYRRPIAE